MSKIKKMVAFLLACVCIMVCVVPTVETNAADGEDELTATAVKPELMEFLDARTYAEKIDILAKMKKELTEDMIQTIAVSLDYPIAEGSITEQYESVLYYLETHARYEGNRLR